MKKKFITNGIITQKINENDSVPEGFYYGRTFKSNPWNKGLTKETNETMKKISEEVSNTLKGNVPWNKGLTKETNESLRIVSEKVSKAMQGNVPWNKGLTKETDARVLKSSQKLSVTRKKLKIKSWAKGLTKETDHRIKRISDKLMGHKTFVTDWKKQKQKEYETRKESYSYGCKSIQELNFINELKSIYGEENVIYPYKDERYPFECDAYIKSEDLFIELNAFWTHGPHPFDKNNLEDIKLLEETKEKNVSFYDTFIKTWTESDPLKLETFRKNNLNFRIIYPIENLIISK